MKHLLFVLTLFHLSFFAFSQWTTSGNDLSTTYSNIILNSTKQSTATLWLGPTGSGPSVTGHYYIKAYDYWGPFLHFQGTGDNGNEKMNVTVDGMVGIGITSPSAKLMVKHAALSDGVKIITDGSDANTAKLQVLYSYNSSSANRNAAIELGRNTNDSGSYKWRLLANSGHTWGNIPTFSIQNLIGGIYNTRLNIANNGNISVGSTDSKGDKFHVKTEGQYFRVASWGIGIADSQWRNTLILSNNYDYHEIYNNGGKSLVLQYKNGGNVGIGTTSPDYKLDVLGTIRANEVKVATGWSDFVFEPDYDLKSLDQVEEFITKNGHLPDIPSAEEVEKNGISLGEMDSKLLQKIEELTLYVIEQNRKLEAQSKKDEEFLNEIKELKKENKELKVDNQSKKRIIDDQSDQINALSEKVELIISKLKIN